MISQQEIEDEFQHFWKTETVAPGDMKDQQREAFRSGAKWAMDKLKTDTPPIHQSHPLEPRPEAPSQA